MKIKYFSFSYICIAFFLSIVSLHAAVLDDFIEKIHSKPTTKHHKKRRVYHSMSEEAQWQTALQFLGYYQGKIDGDLYTEKSFNAITAFHVKHKEIATGFLEEADKRYLSEIYSVISLNRYISYSGKSKRKNKQKLQAALKLKSFYDGKIDGHFGKKSKQAFVRYKTTLENNTTGMTDQLIKERLIDDAKNRVEKRVEIIRKVQFDPAQYTDDSEEPDLVLK
jgi:hypothetical protein